MTIPKASVVPEAPPEIETVAPATGPPPHPVTWKQTGQAGGSAGPVIVYSPPPNTRLRGLQLWLLKAIGVKPVIGMHVGAEKVL
jgi:hypothetical protein